MEAVLDFCYRRFGKAEKTTNRPKSPSPFSEEKLVFDCCNLCCLECTDNVTKWKHAKYNEKRYYFCSEDCWKEWLSCPSQMGIYSPTLIPSEQLKEIESFNLGQSTMESKAGSD